MKLRLTTEDMTTCLIMTEDMITCLIMTEDMTTCLTITEDMTTDMITCGTTDIRTVTGTADVKILFGGCSGHYSSYN